MSRLIWLIYFHYKEIGSLKYINSSHSLLLIKAKGAWGRLYTPLESRVSHMVWSWNLHQTYSLTKDGDWWRRHFGHVTHVYFTDQKPFSKNWKMTSWISFFWQGNLLMNSANYWINSDRPKNGPFVHDQSSREESILFFNFKGLITGRWDMGYFFLQSFY